MRHKSLGTICGMATMVLFVLALAAGCGSARRIELGADDEGREVQVQRGQVLTVTLESNPTTGYSWEWVDAGDGVLRQVGEAEFKSSSNLVGAPGTETLRFSAEKAGRTTIKLVYHRPWEKDVEPLETFAVQVVVR
jgi:inhibitor of cysteine peptidase